MEIEFMEHRRQDFLQKYLELVNCDISDGRGLLLEMSRHYDCVRDRDAYICVKEWHDTLRECIDVKEFVIAMTEREDPPRVNYLQHVGGLENLIRTGVIRIERILRAYYARIRVLKNLLMIC